MRLPSSNFGCSSGYLFFAIMFLANVVGCARLSSYEHLASLPPPEKTCLAAFMHNDAAINTQKINDVQSARIPGYSFLRVNRLLQAFRDRLDTHEKKLSWLNRLAALDTQARQLENNNLPVDIRGDVALLNDCRIKLIDHLASSTSDFENLLEVATVEDSYSSGKRFVGLYALARWPVFKGVLDLHVQENPSQEFQPTGATQLYSSNLKNQHEDLSKDFLQPLDNLGFPKLSEQQRENLRDMYAPVWAIETHTPADSPGVLRWVADEVTVETDSPSEYAHYSYAFFENKLVLQLMYTIWLPAVPPSSKVDIYAGKIDGLTFRVTLDADLKPLLVDVMHNCGCYYMAFPSTKLSPKPITRTFDEPLWIPFEIPPLKTGERFLVQLGTGNHFVTGLSVISNLNAAKKMTVLPYDHLRSLPVSAQENRSVFSSRGLIETSQRLERLVLWPMGVLSAGAMRQSGHHAIAFVGRRHYDDPALISDYFVRR